LSWTGKAGVQHLNEENKYVRSRSKKTEGKDAAEAHGLEYIYQTMNLAVPQQAVDLAQYKNTEALASSNASDRIGAALAVFIDSVASSTQSVDKIDKAMLDYHIAEIDGSSRCSSMKSSIIRRSRKWRPRGAASSSSSTASTSKRTSSSTS